MTISKDKFVSLKYELRTEENGEVLERATDERPLNFICGAGQMLEKFEENLMGLNLNDTFKFKIECKDAYGDAREDAVMDLPKNIFEVDGKIDENQIKIGNVVPMLDNAGNRLQGIVLEITDSFVKMDFNHPLAGDDLFFQGVVIELRDATAEELAALQGSCDSGAGCSTDDCSSCGCSGGCH